MNKGASIHLLYHVVFSTRKRQKSIVLANRSRLYEYMAGIIKQKDGLPVLINGTDETFLALGETPVPEPAELLAWDTTLYPNGDHILRLRVVHEGMNYDEFTAAVKIRN